jgi:lipopolysaccharide export system protein LptA
MALMMAMASSVGAVETRIKGGRMELLNKGDTVAFDGGVRLERGSDTVKADHMTTNGARDKVSAHGNVTLLRLVSSTETWRGYGSSASYDTKTGAGTLIGDKQRAHLIRTTVVVSTTEAVQKMDIFAKRFDFKEGGKHALARGDVYGKSSDPDTGAGYEFWSDEALYDANSRLITLTGSTQPKLKQTTSEDFKTVIGDTITYQIDNRKLVSSGNAEAVFTDLAGRAAKKK